MKQLIEWSKGNPGALAFLIQLVDPKNFMFGISIIPYLEKLTGIRGTNLYVLYSDLCNKDLNKVETLCKTCPPDVLTDACSRQDYSGRGLVAEYLN